MKTYDKIKNWLLVGLVALGTAASLAACDDDDPKYPYDSQLHSFGPSPATRGETVRFIGEGLAGVNKIVFPVGVEVTDFVSKTNQEIVCVVPQEAVPGRIRLIMGGGEILTKATLTFAEPITVESVTAEKANLTAGDEITVKGDYLYNVASVTFGNMAEVTTEDFVKQERETLVVKVPAQAKTGKIVLSDGADWTFTTEDVFEITTAEVTSLSSTVFDYGDEVTIYGENLQLVNRVIFPGDIAAEEFALSADNREITVTVPQGTAPGVIELELFSLDRISTPEFTMPVIEVTSVTPMRNLVVGQKLTVAGKLLDRVTAVEFPGGELIRNGWTVNADGTEMELTVPASMVDGKITFIQNENVSVQSEGLTMAKNGNTFWMGNVDLGNWNANLEVGKDKDMDVWTAFAQVITVPGKLTIHFTQDSEKTYWQLQPRYRRDWAITFTDVRDNGNEGIIETEAGQTTLTLNISQEDIDELNGDGWAFSGCNLTITSMEFENPDAPQTFLTLNYDISPAGQWANLEISATKDADLGVIWYAMCKETITKPGTLILNVETYAPAQVPDGEEIQLQCRYLYDGWKYGFERHTDVITIAQGTTALPIQITQRDVDALQGTGDYATNPDGSATDPWSIGWAFSGKYFIIKSMAFKAN